MLHQKKAPQFHTHLGLQNPVLNPHANGKFKDFSRPLSVFKYFLRPILFSRTFRDSPVYSSTFQACANPAEELLKAPLNLNKTRTKDIK